MKLSAHQIGKNNKGIIVFIHGAGLPGWSWKKQINFFKNDYVCITIDLPDHGSSMNVPFTTIDDVSEELIKTIQEIQPVKKINLIGHSLGAKLVVYILAKHKLDINKTVISSALFNTSKVIELMNNDTLINWSIGFIKKNKSIRKMQIKSFKFNDPEMDERMDEEYAKLTVEGYKRYMHAFSSTMEIPKELYQTDCRNVLITYGSKEIAGIKKTANELAAELNNSKCIELKGCNHLYTINNAKEYNDIVAKWLNIE